jgi:aspartate/methionine/tyrosine aminotransferase
MGRAGAWCRALARAAGIVGSPGDLYGERPARHLRLAVVVPDERLEAVARRLEQLGPTGLAEVLAADQGT